MTSVPGFVRAGGGSTGGSGSSGRGGRGGWGGRTGGTAPRSRRAFGEDSYFDDDDDDDVQEAPQKPPPKRLRPNGDDEDDGFRPRAAAADDEDDEEDPLDAFMAGIEKTVKKEREEGPRALPKPKRDDIEGTDEQEQFFADVLAKKERPSDSFSDKFGPNDSEVPPLPAVDHSTIKYEPFCKDFYEEHEEVAALNSQAVYELRDSLNVRATGLDVPRPCVSFAHFGFDKMTMAVIQKAGFTKPTAIQAQAVPAVMSGRDVLGIAQTGSGKTAAFVWPMMMHVMDQRELRANEGPIAVVLAPTRELCQQISTEAKRVGRNFGLNVVAVFGGQSKWEQTKALQAGAEVVIATPGRLIDMVKSKATNLQRVTYLVLDEADRMFALGFEAQIRSILGQIRPDRQLLLFSATFKKRVESLAREFLEDPVRVVVGQVGDASENVTQIVEQMRAPSDKWLWLTYHLVMLQSAGSLLIFVTRKSNAEELATSLHNHGHKVYLLHGDMTQESRDKCIAEFKKLNSQILIATDVAARGLDIPTIRNVVNYDIARDIDTHTHRVGRTGRAGAKGTAYTLILPTETAFAGQLVNHLQKSNQNVPGFLMEMANMVRLCWRMREGVLISLCVCFCSRQNPNFVKNRGRGRGRGGRGGGGRGGGGYRGGAAVPPPPGLQASSSSQYNSARPPY
eukprot:m.178222 g.178222  ORF g.178222 m.178222 type:complete len:678 (+) comp10446_c0_seq13:1-2034(+)